MELVGDETPEVNAPCDCSASRARRAKAPRVRSLACPIYIGRLIRLRSDYPLAPVLFQRRLRQFRAGGTEVVRLRAVAFLLRCRDNEASRGERRIPRWILHSSPRGTPGQSLPGGRMGSPSRDLQPANVNEVPHTEIHDTQEEARKIRRLQLMISMVMSVIAQDPNLSVEEAAELIANAKRAALAMFPDKELAFDILYKPRLQRLMRERFRLQ
jgi:hypothetical protein